MDAQKLNIILFKWLSAMGLAFFAASVAIFLAQEYNSVAPFHYDSATYLFRALELSDMISAHGRLATFLQVIHTDKDFLDLIFRIILVPDTLHRLYGHMVVGVFFLIVFNLLFLRYALQRTQSKILSGLLLGFILSFPCIYLPYQGMADYWKESIAMWILGCAIMSWLLSDRLNKPRWSLCCSVFFGLLVMERTALAVYIAILFLPLGLCALWTRMRVDSANIAIKKMAVFVLPVGLVTAWVAWIQWSLLYNYYFLKGYDYASYLAVAHYLGFLVFHFKYSALPIFICAFIVLFSLFYKKKWDGDLLTGLWLAGGFPLIVWGSKTLYNGFFNIWCIFLLALLPTSVPNYFNSVRQRKIYIGVLISVLTSGALLQHYLAEKRMVNLMLAFAGFRHFFDEVTTTIVSGPQPHVFSLAVSEDYARLYDHAAFHRNIPLQALFWRGFISVHDSYFRLSFKNDADDPHRLANTMMDHLTSKHMYIVSYCNSEDVAQSIAFGKDAQSIAIPFAQGESNYLKSSPHWQAIKKINSPYGCVYVYQYSKPVLTAKLKWQAVA